LETKFWYSISMPKAEKKFEEPKNVLRPTFTLFDIQMGVGDKEFKKGKKLFDGDKVNYLKSDFRGFNAIVSGTHDYVVFVSANDFDRGNCNCYVGQKDILCKHMIALAIASVFKYRPKDTDIIQIPLEQAVCSGEVRDITKEELVSIKKEISSALKCIKNYGGSSKTWFAYQDSLLKGKRLLIYALSNLPVCEKSADVCINLIIKLDDKLANSGIDDSDGTVGDLVENIMELLSLFKDFNPDLKTYIVDNFPKETNFGWEKELFLV